MTNEHFKTLILFPFSVQSYRGLSLTFYLGTYIGARAQWHITPWRDIILSVICCGTWDFICPVAYFTLLEAPPLQLGDRKKL